VTDLLLPPAYRAVRLVAECSALAEAIRAAAAGIEEGAFFWSDRADRLDAALLLTPDRPRQETLPVIYVAALAFADALGAFAPPPAPISFRWPGGIVIDGGLAGQISLRCAPSAADAAPAWAVLGFELNVAAGGDEPGRTPDRTSIADEDFEGFSIAAQIEGFTRHFLARLARWDAEGLAPIAEEWSRRAFGPAFQPEIEMPDGTRATPVGLDAEGNLRVRQAGGEYILPLDRALADG
jgi:BirA family transcriptional regulator, biotin operon repressor / biotin---[acetyl-CoA-carboxylase] ligase